MSPRSAFGIFGTAEESGALQRFLDEAAETLNEAEHIRDSLRSQQADEVLAAMAGLIENLLRRGDYELLRRHKLQYPAFANLHDAEHSNFELAEPWGPLLDPTPQLGRRWDFAGIPVDLPFGVPASILTSKPAWIEYFARNGFNLLTWRTVRSGRSDGFIERPHHLFAHYLPLDPADIGSQVEVSLGRDEIIYPDHRSSSLNSYGIPSSDPDEWAADFAAAQDLLSHDGQLLMLSVIGTGNSRSEVLDDFAAVCRQAEQAGARAIELNVGYAAAPSDVGNAGPAEPYCHYPDFLEDICRASLDAISDPEIVLSVKLSYLRQELLRDGVGRIAPIVDAISGINSIPVDAVWEDGSRVFAGDGRRPGIAGAAIRDCALDFTMTLSEIRSSSGEYFAINSIGGVTQADHAIALRLAGADAVQAATGAFLNPYLAYDVYGVASEFGDVPGDRDAYVAAIDRGWFGDSARAPFVPSEILAGL